jgi:hypothetical protein
MTNQGATPEHTMEDVDTLPVLSEDDIWQWKIQRAHQTHQLNSIALETTRELPAVPERRATDARTDQLHREIAHHIQIRRASSWSFQALDRLANDLKEISIYRRRT